MEEPFADIADSLRSGRMDVQEYVGRVCDHIEKTEGRIQALIPEADRRNRLSHEAHRLKVRFPDPSSRPPLFGILVGVKDIFSVDGLPTKAGSRLPDELFDAPEAPCVTSLREMGAMILGKTVTTEFAYFAPGPTRNPHNLYHTPGGSSSGSAAAVAAGFCQIALGTQTIGSVIRPAAFCGVLGFKPSYDRIPVEGVIFLSQSNDHVGVFARDMGGILKAAPVLCRNWRSEIESGSRLPVLGIPVGPFINQATKEGIGLFEKHVLRLQDRGYLVRRIEAFEDLDAVVRRHRMMCAGEMARNHRAWFKAYHSLYTMVTVEFIREGLAVSDKELMEAREGRGKLRRELETMMVENGVDLWICPSALGPAPEGIASTGDPAMNLVWTHAGMPAVTLPAGFADNGLPVGLQVVASFEADEELLIWAGDLARNLQ